MAKASFRRAEGLPLRFLLPPRFCSWFRLYFGLYGNCFAIHILSFFHYHRIIYQSSTRAAWSLCRCWLGPVYTSSLTLRLNTQCIFSDGHQVDYSRQMQHNMDVFTRCLAVGELCVRLRSSSNLLYLLVLISLCRASH